jgi:hypothetical protein
MAQDLSAIVVGQTGKIYTAPIGTTAPTDVTTAWGTGWVDLATISEDGLTMAFNEDTSDIKQWGGGVVRKLITSSETTFAFACLESSKQVMEAFYKSTIDDLTAALEIKGGVKAEAAWGFDVLDGATHLRIVVERGEISERGDVVFKADQAAQMEFTVTAYQDENLVSAIMYSDIANWDTTPLAADDTAEPDTAEPTTEPAAYEVA